MHADLEEALYSFCESTTLDGKHKTRTYRTPDGKIHTAERNNESPVPVPPHWEVHTYWKHKELQRILHYWFQQGIALYNAWSAGNAHRPAYAPANGSHPA